MLFDWLTREGWIVVNWWLLVTLAGAAVFPLSFRLLSGLPDRGYTLSRALGLLLVGFVFWLLASLGFFNNSIGSMLFSWLVVFAISLRVYLRSGSRSDLRDWWNGNRRLVLVSEILFFVMLAGWALYRAHQNDLASTEKPMELAFLSGTMRSMAFPPNDAWLSGYAISYYYFGYVIAAMLSTLSGITSTIGANMTISLLFALTGLTSFGVGYNLIRSRGVASAALGVGVLASVFVVLLGNFQAALIELPYQSRSMPASYFNYWGTQARSFASTPETIFAPENANPLVIKDFSEWHDPGWWWFRASRVLTDYNLDGTLVGVQPIDEFPQFSFLLADNHPHVLALPFVLLALGLALNLLLLRRDPERFEVVLYGLCVGGLVFLNTWDGPIYMVVLVAADLLRRNLRNGRLTLDDWLGAARLGLMLVGITFIAYLPFFIGFRSQASGFLPNMLFPTQLQRYFIMFGPFLVILAPYLLIEAWRGGRAMKWRTGLSIGLGLLFFLIFIMAALVLLSTFVPGIRFTVDNFVQQNGGWDNILPGFIQRRLNYGATILVLVIGLVIIAARLFPRRASESQPEMGDQYPAATGFVLLLIAVGCGLSLVPEFFYLGDNFGVRINTIFKFYYQTWVMFSLASAYAIYSIVGDPRLKLPSIPIRASMMAVLGVVLVMGMTYPVLAIYYRAQVERSTNHRIPSEWENYQLYVSGDQFVNRGDILASLADGLNPLLAQTDGWVQIRDRIISIHPSLTLDGVGTMVSADDYAVLQCLSDLVGSDEAVVSEAVRDAYNPGYGRVGSITGIPITLGWPNHERQWRGPTYDATVGTREPDVNQLYTDLRWDVAYNIISRYDIDYVLFGDTERRQYGGTGEQKFADNLDIVCESGQSRVYRVPDDLTLQFP